MGEGVVAVDKNNTYKPPIVTVPLEQYIESRLTSLQVLLESRLEGIEAARLMAHVENKAKLASMNEWRAMTEDRSVEFANKERVEADLRRIGEQIQDLQKFRAVVDSKASSTAMLFTGSLSLLSLLIAIVAVAVAILK